MKQNIAIVGLGALFPGAKSPAEFWHNILAKKVSIRPLPEEMFESEIYFRPDLLNALDKQDKSVTNLAGWIEDLRFDTVRRYRIPPSVAEHMDFNQQAALYTAAQALEMNSLQQVAKDRVAVIFGNGMVGTRYGDAMFRVQFQQMEHYLRQHPAFGELPARDQDELIAYLGANVLKGTIPITEDTAPGVLPNIIAGRIANIYDFHGPSFTVDAACASVLTAVITGIQGLQLGQYDAVICGGADMPLKQLGFVLFSALNALSPDGSFPFDKRANGFVMGQGAGAVILRRLEDALRDGDTIYAVITGYGQASDGKGKYIAAPNAEWQARTVEQACRMAGYPVDTIELIEAHGTATKVGDVVEVAALKQAFASLGATRKGYCGLTSVKSNIGHLKSAAGIAGLIKAVLAIHHKTLPPTANFQEINPKLELAGSPFYIVDEARDWPGQRAHPRRANVSAFGFGGADYHLALEEYRAEDYQARVFVGASVEPAAPALTSSAVAPQEAAELVFLAGSTVADLIAQGRAFLAAAQARSDIPYADFCALHNYNVAAGAACRLAVLAATPDDLAAKLDLFAQNSGRPDADPLRAKGLFFRQGAAITPAETAILFPGQASQYLNMLRTVHDTHDTIRTWYRAADAYWFARHGHTVTSLMFHDGPGEDEALERLRQTENAHPAIFIASYALHALLAQSGLVAGAMIGHSLGEITALAAAGRLAFDDALRLVEQRGYAFHDAGLADPGKMLSLPASLAEAQQLVAESGCAVTVANINGPRQVILAGSSPEVERFKQFLDGKKINARLLFVSHAFHTPLLQPVAERFYAAIEELPFRGSSVRVAMNHTGADYPDDPAGLQAIPQRLREQIMQPVNFVASVERLYQEGVRLFVEVGPSAVLSGLVKEILAGRDARVLTANFKNADDLVSLYKLWGGLYAEGVPVRLPATRRAPAPVTVRAAAEPPPVAVPALPPASAALTERVTVVYSGAAIGLPGSYKQSFRDDNFEQLFAGHNLIERLTDEERQALVDLQITKLIKDENGPTFKLLTTLDDVIQLAGKIGRIDMIRDYHIDEKTVQNMTSCIAHGVAAGYEALKDAQIPLVREYVQTTTGKLLPQRLALPPAMQAETGVIFANGFPLIDPAIHETSRHVSYRYGSKARRELMAFYEGIIGRIKDPDTKKLLTDWYVLYYGRLSDSPGEAEVYRFNHHFMTQISAQANNLLASLINARGPNFQLNAACSSTSNAITIAEDFIRTGRVKRMIVVGADDPSSKTNLPILGAGFLCTGAATNESDLYKAAVPFDRRRNGMIMGAGAVGIVLETEAEAEKRGIAPICEVLGTHSFNTAKHISQIDAETFSAELEQFIGRMERQHGLRRAELARQTVYISHETFTPPRGGCSQTEAQALRRAFGEDVRQIIVGNTKGMTGHTMGAALEDAVAAKALQYGQCPPVVNHAEPDPLLGGLQLWQGGGHDRRYALKMSAGFGAQGHFVLLKQACSGDQRIVDRDRYTAWLRTLRGSAAPDLEPTVEQWGRVLILKEQPPVAASETIPPAATTVASAAPVAAATPPPPAALQPASVPADSAGEAIAVLAQATGYPPEMLEPDMEFGADLGIEAAARTAIAAQLVSHFGLAAGSVALAAETTVGQALDQVGRALAAAPRPTPTPMPPAPPAPAAAGSVAADAARAAVIAETLRVFAEVTKYDEDMLDLDMEMEADLGIDTVKQATILSILGERFQLERQEGMPLSSYPTIRHIVELLHEHGRAVPRSAPPPAVLSAAPAQPQPIPPAPAPAAAGSTVTAADAARAAVIAETLRVFAEVTKYDEDMLDLDMEMEADLGIDTVKQATILSILGERFQLERQEGMPLSSYPTIRHIVELLYEHGRAAPRSAPPLAPAQPQPLPPVPAPAAAPTAPPKAAANSLVMLPVTQAPAPASRPDWQSDLSRQTPTLAAEPLGPEQWTLAGRVVWVLGDDAETVGLVAEACTGRGAAVHPFVVPPAAASAEVEAAFGAFAQGKSVDVIIDCNHIDWASAGAPPFYRLSPAEAEALLFMSSEARFAIYKHLSGQTHQRPAKIICMTAIDGYFGMDPARSQVNDPTYGALAGFYKSLRKEWPGCDVRIVDFAPQALAETPADCLDAVLAEVEHAGVGVEVAYADGARRVVKIVDQERRPAERLAFTAADTFLVTGGGSGIAARIVMALAQAYPVNFVIVDVVSLPDDIAALAALDEAGLEQVKQALHDRLRQEHAKVTPVLLNQEFGKITRAIELYRDLQALQRLGRKAVYVPCDVRDGPALAQGLARARQAVGPITAIIHAAGIDRSHLLEQKSAAEFHDVFTVKASGASNLMAACQDDPLRLVVVFSSIAGRFGNAAQLDYSAANHFITDWAKMMREAHPGIHALSLGWSGWRDVGIAWRNEFVRAKSEELGLNFIEVEQGIAAFMLEIEHRSGDPEVILHRGLDGFIEPGLAAVYLPDYPLVDRLTCKDGRPDRAYRMFSVQRDALIDQHRLGKTPILPAVAYAELAAEYFALQAGRPEHYVVRDMTFPSGFKLFRAQPRELFVTGVATQGGRAWQVEVKSSFKPPKAGAAQVILHSRATVSADLPDLSDLDPAQWPYRQAEPISLPPEESLLLIEQEGPEQRIILGPLYNDVVRDARGKAPVLIYPAGTTYPTYFPREQLTNPKYPLQKLLVNPCLLDSLYQACAANLLVNKKRVFLPWEIGELGIVRVPREEGMYTCHAQVVEETEEVVGFDVVMLDSRRQLCYYARRARFRLINL